MFRGRPALEDIRKHFGKAVTQVQLVGGNQILQIDFLLWLSLPAE